MVEYLNRHIFLLFPSSSLRPRCQLLPLLHGWQVEHATLRRYVLFSATSLLMAVALAFLLGTNTCDMEIGSLLRNKSVRFVANTEDNNATRPASNAASCFLDPQQRPCVGLGHFYLYGTFSGIISSSLLVSLVLSLSCM